MDQKTAPPLWQVQVDPVAASKAIGEFAGMLGIYYKEIMRQTNNNELAIALTVDYQRHLLKIVGEG